MLILWLFALFMRPMIVPRALRENNAIELAYQSACCIGCKHNQITLIIKKNGKIICFKL